MNNLNFQSKEKDKVKLKKDCQNKEDKHKFLNKTNKMNMKKI